MKTLTFPDRTELISERGVLSMVRLIVAVRALAKKRGPSLVSTTDGKSLNCFIIRDLPRVGGTIQLTEGETALWIFPRRLAKELVVDVKHSPDCCHDRRPAWGAWRGCSCAAMLTLRKREAGH